MSKIIVCSCEDVALGEIFSAVGQGFTDIESLKRLYGHRHRQVSGQVLCGSNASSSRVESGSKGNFKVGCLMVRESPSARQMQPNLQGPSEFQPFDNP